MLPVSGALQLKTSLAHQTRPITLGEGRVLPHRGPAPRSVSGMNRFQSFAARASPLSASIVSDGFHPPAAISSRLAIPRTGPVPS
jgi:hypothetical protein